MDRPMLTRRHLLGAGLGSLAAASLSPRPALSQGSPLGQNRLVLLGTPAPPLHAAASDLDLSFAGFGVGGKVVTDINAANNSAPSHVVITSSAIEAGTRSSTFVISTPPSFDDRPWAGSRRFSGLSCKPGTWGRGSCPWTDTRLASLRTVTDRWALWYGPKPPAGRSQRRNDRSWAVARTT